MKKTVSRLFSLLLALTLLAALAVPAFAATAEPPLGESYDVGVQVVEGEGEADVAGENSFKSGETCVLALKPGSGYVLGYIEVVDNGSGNGTFHAGSFKVYGNATALVHFVPVTDTDRITGDDFRITDGSSSRRDSNGGKENVGTGSSGAPVIALSALVLTAGAALLLAKRK